MLEIKHIHQVTERERDDENTSIFSLQITHPSKTTAPKQTKKPLTPPQGLPHRFYTTAQKRITPNKFFV